MSNWKQFYESLRKLREGYEEEKPSLRFERKSIWASEVGSQLFCETSLKLDYVLGELETEEMRMGREAHAELKEVLKSIYSDRLSFAMELPFIAWNQDEAVFMLGRPDRIFFKKGVPSLVVELKFNSISSYYIGKKRGKQIPKPTQISVKDVSEGLTAVAHSYNDS